MGPTSLKKYTFFTFIFTAAALIALFLPEGNKAGPVLALAYFLGHGQMVGGRFLPKEPRLWRGLLGTLIFLASLVTAASLAYYFYRLDLLATGILLILTPVALGLIPENNDHLTGLVGSLRISVPARAAGMKTWLGRAAALALTAVNLLLLNYGFSLLRSGASDIAMRSPWDHVPRMFFVVFFLAALGIFTVAYSGLIGEWALLPAAGLAFLAVSAAAAVYAVGFGFDPFIHQATEAVIYRLGAIEPKPFYYVGQYSLVVILARLTRAGVAAVDTYLVPAAFALTLPVAYWSLKRAFGWSGRAAAAASLALLLLPLSPFIATTPQGLADALALMTFFLALPVCAEKALPRPVLVLLAAAVTLVHPLAGIPLAVFVAILLVLTARERRGGVGLWLVLLQLFLAGCIALPLAFMANARVSDAGVAVSETLLSAPTGLFEELTGAGIVSRQFNAAFDFVYFWRTVRQAVIALAGLAGLALLVGRRLNGALAYGVSFIVFLVNYFLLLSVVRFPFLIEYERSNYADRILDLALFLLAPPALYAFGRLISRVRRGFPPLKVGLALGLAALAVSSLYLAYPRRDKYESSRGWSTGAADLAAVRRIDQDAGGAPYVVLANQAVAAGAVRELGFRAYYPSRDPERPGEIFFYPIPTGGPLYADFLEMNSSLGAAATAARSMDLTGVDTVYFVVNNYWWHAQKIVSAAKRQADAWWTIDNSDYVFKYVRKR